MPQPANAQSCNFCTTVTTPFSVKCVCVPGGIKSGACPCNAAFEDACPIYMPDCMGEKIGQYAGAPVHAVLAGAHVLLRELNITLLFKDNFKDYRTWFSTKFFDEHIREGLRDMNKTMMGATLHQAFLVGTLFDAKQHLETTRTLQELENEAMRDYIPSDELCTIGTSARNLAATESYARYNALGINAHSIRRQLSKSGTASTSADAASKLNDKAARWKHFTTTYCDPQDNGWKLLINEEGKVKPSGLMNACGIDGGGETERLNIDIDYGRLIERQRTLDLAFDQSTPNPDREDVLALAKNLYAHDIIRPVNTGQIQNLEAQSTFLELRALTARRNVAENSYNAIVKLKSSGGADNISPASNREYLAATLTQIGVPAGELENYIGEDPSYYAQLEILAKKIYQNPQFFANLYDTPANTERTIVALKAIEIMLDRAIFESELRQEMVSSIMLSSEVANDVRAARDILLNEGGLSNE